MWAETQQYSLVRVLGRIQVTGTQQSCRNHDSLEEVVWTENIQNYLKYLEILILKDSLLTKKIYKVLLRFVVVSVCLAHGH